MSECAICCDRYNSTTRAKVPCEHSGICEFEACKTCVKTYILGTTSDPNCMHCNKAWSDKFIGAHLKPSFLRGEYATHRKELLLQQQLIRMPESMAAAEGKKQNAAIKLQLEVLKAQRTECMLRVLKIKDDIEFEEKRCAENTENIKTTNITKKPNPETIKILKKELAEAKAIGALLLDNSRQLLHNIRVIETGGELVGEEKKEARKFIMPCPNGDCRGYLSTQYKCELCEYFTCSKCFEVIDKDDDAIHTCKQENVDSADYIKKQSKPCPCCGTRISKIDGCDQMWCTQCHKAFSWNTGKIVTGVIHNPHFYQYQRANGATAPRNPGDVVCGGLCSNLELTQALYKLSCISGKVVSVRDKGALFMTVTTIHRLQNHMTYININPLRRKIIDELDFGTERVQYILQQITKEELATNIIRKDNARKRNVTILHIYELFTAVAIDMFHAIIVDVKTLDELKNHIDEYHKLRVYCNEHFKELSMLYGSCVPFIDAEWNIDSTKYNSKGLTDKYIEKREETRKARKVLKE
jgi:hypothetical protein